MMFRRRGLYKKNHYRKKISHIWPKKGAYWNQGISTFKIVAKAKTWSFFFSGKDFFALYVATSEGSMRDDICY
jgi:hypothetical protein